MSTTTILLRIAQTAALALAAVLLLLVLAHVAGERRWSRVTAEIQTRMPRERGRYGPRDRTSVDLDVLAELPAPVRRYLRRALPVGGALIDRVQLTHSGTFNMGESTDRWSPFESTQLVLTTPPAFDWDARIRILPGLPARVHDAFVDGEGVLYAAILGLFTVADQRDSSAMAEGELMRFLAESPWYPTVLMPGQGVVWSAVDDLTADATLTTDAHTVTLRFTFGADATIETVRSETRGRRVGDALVPTPWEGRFWGYAFRDGIRVPLEGEVAWLLPEGRKPYWRARLDSIDFSFAR